MTSAKTKLCLCRNNDWVESAISLANPSRDTSFFVKANTTNDSDAVIDQGSWSSQASMRDLGVMSSANGICQEYLLSYATTPLVVWDTEYRITLYNRAFERLVGRPPRGLIGSFVGDIFPMDIRDHAMRLIRDTSASTGLESVELHVTSAGGEVLPLLWNSTPMTGVDGETVVSVVAMGVDITARHRAEQQLRESELRYKTILQATFEGVVTHNEGEILDVNSVFEDMFGVRREEIIGNSILDFMVDRSHELVQRKIRTHNGQPYEALVRHANGREFPVEIIAIEQLYAGRVVRVAALRDLTRQKTAEDALRRANEELRHDRTLLQRKNAALGEILDQFEDERTRMAADISSNMERTILPTLRALISAAGEADRALLERVLAGLQEITDPFMQKMESHFSRLSPRELEICSMIKSGMSCKDVAASLNVSVHTVLKQRQRIRKKLGITRDKINLSTYLNAL